MVYGSHASSMVRINSNWRLLMRLYNGRARILRICQLHSIFHTVPSSVDNFTRFFNYLSSQTGEVSNVAKKRLENFLSGHIWWTGLCTCVLITSKLNNASKSIHTTWYLLLSRFDIIPRSTHAMVWRLPNAVYTPRVCYVTFHTPYGTFSQVSC